MSVCIGEPVLQSSVFLGHIGVSSQVIAKCEPLGPERASQGYQVQMVRASGHDVDHRLGVQTRYRGTPNVFNRVGHQPWADHVDKKPTFRLESRGLVPIVLNNV